MKAKLMSENLENARKMSPYDRIGIGRTEIKNENTSYEKLEGDYVIMDPCYLFPDELDDVWQKMCPKFTDTGKMQVIHQGKVLDIVYTNTAYGDGSYKVQGTNKEIPVDAGMFAAIPLEQVMKWREITNPEDMDDAAIVKGVNGWVDLDGNGNMTGDGFSVITDESEKCEQCGEGEDYCTCCQHCGEDEYNCSCYEDDDEEEDEYER